MAVGLLGRKVGMTQTFDSTGQVIPVTVIQAGPCYVLQLKTEGQDGYEAVQLGYLDKPRRLASRSVRGHVAPLDSKRRKQLSAAGVQLPPKANCEPKRFVRELRVPCAVYEVGQVIKADVFLDGFSALLKAKLEANLDAKVAAKLKAKLEALAKKNKVETAQENWEETLKEKFSADYDEVVTGGTAEATSQATAEITAEALAEAIAVGIAVDITGTSKGRGTAGVMKRHNFRGQRASHGVKKVHRHAGSIGMNTDPHHVFKGHRMAGHMGAERSTVRNLTVVGVDLENDLLLVRGAIPGPNGGYVMIRTSNKLGPGSKKREKKEGKK